MARTMREGGLRTTLGTVMPTMQAICLGGGSLVNSAICVRAPEFVLDRWCTDFDLAHTRRADLDPHYDAVGAVPRHRPHARERARPRNLLFKKGCDALGISSEPISRNVRGCRGSGECFTGCRSRAKQSMDISYVPAALRGGASVLSSVRVEQVLVEGRRAAGVVGRVVAPFTGGRASKSGCGRAGWCSPPAAWRRRCCSRRAAISRTRSGQVGANLQFHPGVAMLGVFPDLVHPQFGATQGYQSLHFLREGFKLETLWAPPAVLAVRMPGAGLRPQAAAGAGAALGGLGRDRELQPLARQRARARRGARSEAHLEPPPGRRPDPRPRPPHAGADLLRGRGAGRDARRARDSRGAALAGRGRGPADAAIPRAARFVTGGNHAFCSTRMHGDPRRGVVDEFGRCHDLEGLYIADTGIFPQCPSVNPMWTGMALAHRTALALADRLWRSRPSGIARALPGPTSTPARGLPIRKPTAAPGVEGEARWVGSRR